MKPEIPDEKILVQYDGYCILCSRTVRYILKADRKKKFVFRPISNQFPDEPSNTVIVTHRNLSYRYFDAILKIGKELGGIYRLVYCFRILPRAWRDRLYRWIALNRIKWFGRRQSCYLPDDQERQQLV